MTRSVLGLLCGWWLGQDTLVSSIRVKEREVDGILKFVEYKSTRVWRNTISKPNATKPATSAEEKSQDVEGGVEVDVPSTTNANIANSNRTGKAQLAPDVIAQIWDAYSNASGVVIKLLECGDWGVPLDLKACALHSLKSQPASLLRKDLPALAFFEGHSVGWLYKSVPRSGQLCAAPFDSGSANCDDKPACSDATDAFVEDFHRRIPFGRVYSDCYEKGRDSWERAFAKQKAVVSYFSAPQSTKLAAALERFRIAGPGGCVLLYNQVMMNCSSIHDIQAITYRNDSSWPKEIPRHFSLRSLAMARRLQATMLDEFNLTLPLVELKLPAAHCYWPNTTAPNASDMFLALSDGDPRLEYAAEMEKNWKTVPSQYVEIDIAVVGPKPMAAITPNTMLVLICLLGTICAATVWQYQKIESAPFVCAGLSSVYFAFDSFFIALSGQYLRTPSAHMVVMFVIMSSSLLVSVFSPAYWCALRKATMSRDCTFGFSFVLLTGALIAIAQICSNVGFSMKPQDSGPHQAIMCANVLIVSPFFYAVWNESLTELQLLGCALIISGCVVMSDVLHWTGGVGNGVSTKAFLWLCLAMVFYSASDITLRFASRSRLPRHFRALVITQAVGVAGAALFIAIPEQDGAFSPYWESPALLIWPLLNAFACSFGLTTISTAFENPGAPTGALSTVVNTNSVALVLLNWALLGYVPSPCKVTGMGLILAGMIVFNIHDM